MSLHPLIASIFEQFAPGITAAPITEDQRALIGPGDNVATLATLRGARAVVERGWTPTLAPLDDHGNARWFGGATRYSVYIAIHKSATSDAAAHRAHRALLAAINSVASLGAWEEDPDRTQRDVLYLCDRAIALVEECA